MKRLRLLSVLLLLMVQMVLWAGPRTYQQAQAIAERLAAQMGVSITPEARARSFSAAPASPSSKISLGVALPSAKTQAYYIFPYGEDRGYAIVSGDDQMPEVVAYSDRGTFDETKMPDGCRGFLDAYEQLADRVAKGDANALRVVAQKRALKADGGYQQPSVSPLLGEIKWAQSAPYNNLCPFNEDMGKRCVTGCVATALAQVMRYWRYPETLQVDIPAYTSVSPITGETYEMPQIDKGVKYDWDNMLPVYGVSADSYTQQQADAVATLMLHLGAANTMAYCPDGSAAYLAAEPLVKYFGYDPDLLCAVYRGDFEYKEWCKLIDNELMVKRPVIYGGNSSSGGHMFVCDGADGEGLYHINWGWSGINNGFFDIAILSPSSRGTGTWAGSDGFNADAQMLIGLQPDNHVKDEPLVVERALAFSYGGEQLEIVTPDRLSAMGKFGLDLTLTFFNVLYEPFGGVVSLGIEDEQGRLKPLMSEFSSMNLPAADEFNAYFNNVQFQFSYAFPVGTTRIYPIYSTDGGATWGKCSPWGNMRPIEVEATATHLQLVDEISRLQASFHTDGDVIAGQSKQFSYTVRNDNLHDYLGQVYVYVSDEAKCPKNPSRFDFLDIAAGGSTTHSLTLTPQREGKLYVWLYDEQHRKMLVDGQAFEVKEDEAVMFKLLSKSINWKQGEYETENAYLKGYRVKMPLVDGDEAVVKYELQNRGETYQGELPLIIVAYGSDGDFKRHQVDKTCTLEGNGAITQLEYRFKASDLGNCRSFTCNMSHQSLGNVDYSAIDVSRVDLVDYASYYSIDQDILYGYFATDLTSIAVPTAVGGLQVSAGKGSLSLSSGKAQTVDVYNMAGQLVRHLSLQAGTTTTITVPGGIYMVGKQKVMVR